MGKLAAIAIGRERGAEKESIFSQDFHVTFFHLFWIYTITSVLGLFCETLVSYPIDGVWKDRAGLVWGPFSPIFGVGALLMTVFLDKYRNRSWVVMFIAAAVLGGVFEWAAGTFWQQMFGFVAWDYSTQPFNLGGKTCLGIAIVWGILGVLWMKALLPIVVKMVELIPEKIRWSLTIVCFAFTMADVLLTLGAFSCWFDRQSGVPITNDFQRFFATCFGDDFMTNRFQTISMYPVLAQR